MADGQSGNQGSIAGNIGQAVGQRLGAKAVGAALGTALGSVAPGVGNIIGNAAGAIIASLPGVSTALKWVVYGFFGFVAALILILIVPIMVPIMMLMMGLGGGPGTVEAAPSAGDGSGLVADFCVHVAVPPDGACSQELKQILEAAGAWAKIPAGVIAGILPMEGPQLFGYTDEQIRAYSSATGGTGIGGQGIDPMNSTPNTCSAIGPAQILIDRDPDYPTLPPNPPIDGPGHCSEGARSLNNWTQSGTSPVRYKSAVNLSGLTTIPNPDARNIRNAIFGAAWKLKCDNTPSDYAGECTSGQFTKYDYNDNTDSWEQDDVFRSAGAYFGTCSPPANYCQRVYDFYLAVADTSATGGTFSWPNSGFISQGPYQAPTHQGNYGSSVDINADIGKPVFATVNGNLIYKQFDSTGALDVAIETATHQYWYVHFSRLSRCTENTPIGGFVPEGELIGFVGDTGLANLPHTHYMIRNRSNQVISESEFRSLLPKPDIAVNDNVSTNYNGVNCKP